jgi:hypothetical protein
MAFFADDDYYSGPVLTPDLIVLAEARLGYRLPAAYLQLLGERNGGVPLRRCFKTNVATSWHRAMSRCPQFVASAGGGESIVLAAWEAKR